MSGPKFRQWPNSFAAIARGLVFLTGAAVLLGWALHISVG